MTHGRVSGIAGHCVLRMHHGSKSIRHSLPSCVGNPDARNLDHAPADPLPPQCRGRKPVADKACQEVEREAVSHHELVGAPSLTGIGEHRKRAVLFRAEALCHQIISLRRMSTSPVLWTQHVVV